MSFELSPGSIFDKNYEILSFIGTGGMGFVYKARQKGLDRIVALKLLKLGHLKDPESLSRFEREARSLSMVLNKHIACFYNYGKDETGLHYIAMEYLEGKSLRKTLIEEDSLSWLRAVNITKQVCEGMAAAHEQGTINRDLKPENIILLQEPEKDFVKIIDFGLAKLISKKGNRIEVTLTRTGQLVGTVNYLSPEQCKGKPADERSDIYSLGCILYEMLVGRVPFEADNPIGVLHMHVNQELTFPPGTELDLALKKIIKRSTAKQPSKRYQSMLKMQEDLSLLESGNAHLVAANEEADSDKARSERQLAQFVRPILFSLSGLMIMAGIFAVFLFNTDLGKVIQAKIDLVNPSRQERIFWLSEADKLEAVSNKKHAQEIIDLVKASFGPDIFSFYTLQNEYAERLLEEGSKEQATKWAWRTITAIGKVPGPKSDSSREFYSIALDKAADIVLKAGLPIDQQMKRSFLAICNDPTRKFRHFGEKENLTALAYKIVIETEQNLGKNIYEALIFHVQNVAKKTTITRALNLLPTVQARLSKSYEKSTALEGTIRLYLILADEAMDAHRHDLATALIDKARKKIELENTTGANRDLCNYYINLACSYRRIGDLSEAANLEREAINSAVDAEQQALAKLELAVTLIDFGRYSESAKLSREALELTRSVSSPAAFNIGRASIGNLANSLIILRKPNEAIACLSDYLSYLQAFRDQEHASHILRVILQRAKIYCEIGNHALAEIDFISAAKLIHEQNLGQDCDSRLLESELSCALKGNDTERIRYFLKEIEQPTHMQGINLSASVSADTLRRLRKSDPKLADEFVELLDKQQLLLEKTAPAYANESKRIVSLLLKSGEYAGAKAAIDRALRSNLLFEKKKDWFKEKAMLLETPNPSINELTKDLGQIE